MAVEVQAGFFLPAMPTHKVITGDSAEALKHIESQSVHLVVTSPPYDNLRSYGTTEGVFTFDFNAIATELQRILVPGGVICWVVANQVKNWGESLTAERQRVAFQDLGFSVRKIIYHKLNFANPNATFYHRLHEDVTICCNGKKPQAWNPIFDIPTVWKKALGRNTKRLRDGSMSDQKAAEYGDVGKRGDVWIGPTSGQENPCKPIAHPATMPKWLTQDLIKSWSNPGDTVLDPFAGSGTTGRAAMALGRSSILVEINPEYSEMCRNAILPAA
jgi:DNA modification methylase